MENYEKFVSKGILKQDPNPLPGRVVKEGSHLAKYFPVGSKSPNIYTVEISADQFVNVMKSGKFKDKNHFYYFVIHDEGKVTSYDDCMLRFQFLQYLSEVPYAIYNFRLSDSSLPAYISFMESVNWNRDQNTLFQMVLNHFDSETVSKIPLDQARGQLHMKEEDLIWYSDSVLQRLRNKVDGLTLGDTFQLKKAINEYCDKIDRTYYKAYFTDFDKAYLAYHYLFDPRSFNNIDIDTLDIGYANSQITTDANGLVHLKKSLTCWESRPVGTLNHGKGVCTGQARLFSSLLWNPEMKVPATHVFGKLPTGEEHCWSEFQAHGYTYQCCTTMKGLFQDLDVEGYKPDPGQYFPYILPHFDLDYHEIEEVKQHVKSLKK